MASAGKPPRILMIVENLPVPFDRRVWQEATTLVEAGYEVSVICPTGNGFEARYEVLDGIHIWRHPLPLEASGAWGYMLEYGAALFWEALLALRVHWGRGFDVIHACNPPDLIFLVAMLFRPFGKRFVFDHHDLNPELYEAKFGQRTGFFYRLLIWLERRTFAAAAISIATNDSYRRIAISRGGMPPDRVYVVRSGPDLKRLRPGAPDPTIKNGARFLVGYAGVMGQQEGIDALIRIARIIIHERGRDDIRFRLVGGGTELEAMRAYAVEQGVADHVCFTGRVPDADLLATLNTADVCVNPDTPGPLNDLSTMNKIMEYMALGKPIVQFDLHEGRVSAGEASLYAHDERDFADKILDLLDDPDRCARMGAFGRARIEQELAWVHEAPKLKSAYARLFETARRQAPNRHT